MGTIMVVDDSTDLCDTLKTLLEKKGHKIIVTNNGEEFLQRVVKRMPDLVLLDVMMPGLNTREILEALEKKGLTELKVILITVVRFSQDEVQELMGEFNIVDYIAKPFEIPVLLASVKKHLS